MQAKCNPDDDNYNNDNSDNNNNDKNKNKNNKITNNNRIEGLLILCGWVHFEKKNEKKITQQITIDRPSCLQ